MVKTRWGWIWNNQVGSIPASTDTEESEGRADEAVLKSVHKKLKNLKNSRFSVENLTWILEYYISWGWNGMEWRKICGEDETMDSSTWLWVWWLNGGHGGGWGFWDGAALVYSVHLAGQQLQSSPQISKNVVVTLHTNKKGSLWLYKLRCGDIK